MTLAPGSSNPASEGNIPSLGPRGEGWVGLQVACFFLLALAIALAPRESVGDATAVDTRRIVGYLVGIIGAFLLGAGIAELRRARAFTALPRPNAEGSLVERGPYRLVRHPIYGGLILGALGLAVITPWIGTFAAVFALAVVLDLKRRREELWLVDRFPGYPAYRARTRAMIPFLY